MQIEKIVATAERIQKILGILKQKTTWAGLFVLAGVLGLRLSPEIKEFFLNPDNWIAISEAIAALVGVLLVLFNEDRAQERKADALISAVKARQAARFATSGAHEKGQGQSSGSVA